MKSVGQKTLFAAMLAVMALHAAVLSLLHQPATASRFFTAAMPMLTAACFVWRSRRLPERERLSWWWLSAAIALWGAAQALEAFISHSTSASNLAADPADFLYLIAAFPLLMAISNTAETESIRGIFAVNLSQVLLAAGLTYVRLFHMSMSVDEAATVMLKIYAAECALLAIAAFMRLATWATLEERRRMRLMCITLWIYLPIELSLDYATKRWNLQKGTLLDLLWGLPFLFAGWRALQMPMEDAMLLLRSKSRGQRMGLLLQSLCPMLITVGVFALAASIWSQHFFLALGAMFLLLLIQGLHSGMVQLNYLEGRSLLLDRERELKVANAELEQLSLLDPLTGVANRRQFTTALEAEWKRALRRQESMALLMVDVDFFKSVNDLHGHTYGDTCLVKIAHVLHDDLRRANDMVARYGGEEFVLLLPETDMAGAMIVAERLRQAVDAAQMENKASPFDQKVTVSIGVSAIQPWPTINETALINSADQALYEAKQTGRHRICAQECQLSLPKTEIPAM
jgi:diguanylate cyclase (GGDEF)-like protein